MANFFREVHNDGYCEYCLEDNVREYVVQRMEYAVFDAGSREKAKMQFDAGEWFTGGHSATRVTFREPIKRVDIFYAHPNL